MYKLPQNIVNHDRPHPGFCLDDVANVGISRFSVTQSLACINIRSILSSIDYEF